MDELILINLLVVEALSSLFKEFYKDSSIIEVSVFFIIINLVFDNVF